MQIILAFWSGREKVVYRSLYFLFFFIISGQRLYCAGGQVSVSVKSSLLIGLHLALIISAGFFLIKRQCTLQTQRVVISI